MSHQDYFTIPVPHEEVYSENSWDDGQQEGGGGGGYGHGDEEYEREDRWSWWVKFLLVIMAAITAFVGIAYMFPDNDLSRWFNKNVVDRAITVVTGKTTTAAPPEPEPVAARMFNGFLTFLSLTIILFLTKTAADYRNAKSSDTGTHALMAGGFFLCVVTIVFFLDGGGDAWGYSAIFVLAGLGYALTYHPSASNMKELDEARDMTLMIALISIAVIVVRQVAYILFEGMTFFYGAFVSIAVVVVALVAGKEILKLMKFNPITTTP